MLSSFIEKLQTGPAFDAVFNPWRDVDTVHELGPEGPVIRAEQLQHYFEHRLQSARYLLIAEALGYQGGHFSGIAMTSERIVLGHQIDRGINPHDVLPTLTGRRTSKPSCNANGFSEPTASIVWQAAIDKLQIAPMDFVLWNVFPWHPYQQQKGMLSNRTPTPAELAAATPYLLAFLELFPDREIIAVGRKSERLLADVGVKATAVRHPANGGATKFRDEFAAIIQGK
jgi:hypothetical protein